MRRALKAATEWLDALPGLLAGVAMVALSSLRTWVAGWRL